MVLGFGMFIHSDAHSSKLELNFLQVIAGVETGLSYSGPLLALQAQILSKDNATATSTFDLIRNLSMAISVVIGGVVSEVLTWKCGESIAARLTGKEANVINLGNLDESMREAVRTELLLRQQ